MKPLIVAATRAEVAPSIPFLDEHNISYIITGVGMVATAYALTKALHRYTPSYVLNVGIAGSFSPDLLIGSVVEVIQDTLAELGAEGKEGFITIDELGFGSSSWSSRPRKEIQTNLRQVEGITVNKVHGKNSSIQSIQQRLPDIQTESMEGAAVFYVCAEEDIPCLQVRAISNFVDVRDKSTWDIPLAVQNLHHWLIDFLAR